MGRRSLQDRIYASAVLDGFSVDAYEPDERAGSDFARRLTLHSHSSRTHRLSDTERCGHSGCRYLQSVTMLLYMSSGRIEYLSRLLYGRVDFASNIAFETSDDVALAHSLCGSSTHVCLGP